MECDIEGCDRLTPGTTCEQCDRAYGMGWSAGYSAGISNALSGVQHHVDAITEWMEKQQ